MPTTRILCLALSLLAGCASTSAPHFAPFTPQPVPRSAQGKNLPPAIDRLMILVDASSSMDDIYEPGGLQAQSTITEFAAARELLRRLFLTIPDVDLAVGLDTFGFGRCLPWNFTDLHVPIQRFSRSLALDALDGLQCAGDGPTLVRAIEAAANQLATAGGRSALLLISDGEQPRSGLVQRIREMKRRFKGSLCVHTVWVGNLEQSGKSLMAELPEVAGCGQIRSVSEIGGSGAMAEFVSQLIFESSR